MRLLEWWGFPRRAWLLILVELCVIIGLSGWVVSEYLNNVYFQGYLNGLAPVIVPVVSAAFGAVSATVAVVLFFGMRSLRAKKGSDAVEAGRPVLAQARAVRKGQQAEPRALRPVGVSGGVAKSRSPAAGRSSLGRKDASESAGGKGRAEPDEQR